jgi:hypothetical protein
MVAKGTYKIDPHTGAVVFVPAVPKVSPQPRPTTEPKLYTGLYL